MAGTLVAFDYLILSYDCLNSALWWTNLKFHLEVKVVEDIFDSLALPDTRQSLHKHCPLVNKTEVLPCGIGGWNPSSL